MTANYYTLRAVLLEIEPDLVGAKFVEAYSHRPNELRLKFEAVAGGHNGVLVIMLRPIDGAMFLTTREEQRPRANTRSFFTEIAGYELTAVSISDTDRLISLLFGEFRLVINFFGSPNAILERGEERLSSFKKLPGSNETITTKEAQVFLRFDPFSMLGKRYRKELDLQDPGGEAPVTAETLHERLIASREAIIYRKQDEILLSLIPLHHLIGWQAEHLTSVNEGVRNVLIERSRLTRTQSLRQELMRIVTSQLDRLYRTRADMRKGVENSDKADRYVLIANAILMVAHEIPKLAEEWMIDLEANGEAIGTSSTREKVKLDPKLSAYENAARYFERSKRARESKETLKARSIEISAEISDLESLRASISEATDAESLAKLQRHVQKQQARKQIDEIGDKAPTFRQFEVAGGLTVLVGKNAKQNDDLTLHVAKKEDIWLHARGVPGSHVVLQTGKRTNISKEAIEQAAEIAAFYSDARTQGIAPVSYTQKKYVRKPSGAAVGAVRLEREDVIMVKPQIRGKQ